MDEEREFRMQIAANPWDESPRLRFADWLEEHGRDQEAAYWREFDADKLYRDWRPGKDEPQRIADVE
ncbi:MAG: TIGR02996 domain-containing protein [Planctomycetales bacterium]